MTRRDWRSWHRLSQLAKALYNATEKRIRELPITRDKLLSIDQPVAVRVARPVRLARFRRARAPAAADGSRGRCRSPRYAGCYYSGDPLEHLQCRRTRGSAWLAMGLLQTAITGSEPSGRLPSVSSSRTTVGLPAPIHDQNTWRGTILGLPVRRVVTSATTRVRRPHVSCAIGGEQPTEFLLVVKTLIGRMKYIRCVVRHGCIRASQDPAARATSCFQGPNGPVRRMGHACRVLRHQQ